MRSRFQALLAALLSSTLASCEAESGEDARAAAGPSIPTPLVQIAGCDEVDPDGACRLRTRETSLRLWVDVHAASEVEVRTEHEVLEITTHPVDGGLALAARIPADARRVGVTGIDTRWDAPHEIPIRRWDPPPQLAAVDVRGDPDAAIATLEAALPRLHGEDWLWAMNAIRSAHHVHGDPLAAARVIAQMLAAEEAPEARRTRAHAASAAVHMHAYARQDVASAEPFLQALHALAPGLPEAAAWAANSRALVARRLGDVTEARDAFAEAERIAARLGDTGVQSAALSGLATTLGELGRSDEAIACIERLLALARTAELGCQARSAALNTAGWALLLLVESGRTDLDPSEPLEDALDAWRDHGECPSSQAEHARFNLAYHELLRGEPTIAREHLERIGEVPHDLAPWMTEARATVDASLDRWDLMPSPLHEPDPAWPLGLRWKAKMRQAATWAHFGVTSGEIAAYMEAEALIDEAIDAIGIDLGREPFLATKQASAHGLVAALVRSGRADEALCRVRLARNRALRRLDRTTRLAAASPEARAQWRADALSVARLRARLEAERARDLEFSEVVQVRRRAQRASEEQRARRGLDRAYAALGTIASATECAMLSGPQEGVVTLAAFAREDGLDIFVADTTGTTVRSVDVPSRDPDASWVAQALSPDAARIEAATHIRIVATGQAAQLRWHALPWNEGVLLDVAPVVYALDVPASHREAPDRARAVVVADPSENLPLARREAGAVEQTLEDEGWSVELLDGAHADRSTVATALSNAALLHYAGHGEQRGIAGWDAALLLADGQSFGVADVLALPHGPHAVVLSGCETGRVSPETLEGGMNLGNAFVLAGAAWVVVADVQVADVLSEAIGTAIYDGATDLAVGGPAALRRAQLELRTKDPAADWAAFRVLVP